MARRYALVIGIGENEAPLASLSKPVDDARAIAAVLRSVGGFEVQEWVGRVDRQDLERAIERLLEQAEGQEALIYYTGHAVPLRKAFGQMEALLAGSDCVVVAEDGMAVQQQNGLSLGDLNQVLGAANLGNLVLLLDCCHSGYLLEKQLLQQTFTNFAKKDYLLITACRSFEQAYANRSDRHSLFTGAVLAGLGRENGDEQGVVTGDRLFAFVSRQLEGTGQEALRLSVGRPIELVRYPLETVVESIAPMLQMTNPYQGLKAFTAETRQFFFGRDREIQALVQKVQTCGFVPVIGASGSGKSSVVRAGLIPRLEELGWRVLPVMIPGTDPIAALQSSIDSLDESTETTLLVVDQFEEVFTLCRDRSEQSKFIQALMNLKLRVVVTMRADFVEACLADADLTRSIQADAVYLGPMVGEALEAAIEQPAIVQGATLQPKLLAQILQDVAEEENCLPLLEFALSELWERTIRSSPLAPNSGGTEPQRELLLGDYRRLGGIVGALDAHAEGLYKALASQRREQWVKPVLLRLVRTGEGTRDTRQRQRKSDLLEMAKDAGEREAIESVIQSLVDGRLLVSDRVDDQDVIDLSHEALMRSWKRLVTWREGDREVRRIVDAIEDARRAWTDKGKKRRDLLEGRLLKDGKRLLKEAPAEVFGAKGFIRKSLWWRRSQFASWMMIPIIFIILPWEYYLREQGVKRDLESLNSSNNRLRVDSLANLTRGCFATTKYKWASGPTFRLFGYISQRMFGNCRSLSGSNLENIQSGVKGFQSLDLSGVDYVKGNLSHSMFVQLQIRNAQLSETNLNHIRVSGADFQGTSLTGVRLEKANIYVSNLSNVDFLGANLTGSEFFGVNLSGANLSNTNLKNVQFKCTTSWLIKVNLKNIKWDKNTNWEGVRGWQCTENIPPALKQQLGLK